jgi:hypothetical protein
MKNKRQDLIFWRTKAGITNGKEQENTHPSDHFYKKIETSEAIMRAG